MLNPNLSSPKGTAPTPEHSGNWACGVSQSEGIVLKVGQKRAAGIYYTFEGNHPSRRFYPFTFPLANFAQFPLFTSELVGSLVVQRQIGVAQISFTDPQVGYFKIDTDETDVYGFPLTALQLTTDPRSGPWVVNEESGQGYWLGLFDGGLTTLHTFWNHPSWEPWPGMYPDGNHTQEWESGLPLVVSEGVYSADMRRVTNGQRGNAMKVDNPVVESFTMRMERDRIHIIRPHSTEVLKPIVIA